MGSFNDKKPNRVKCFLKNIIVKLNDWINIIIYLFVLVIFYLPILLAIIIRTKSMIIFASLYCAFWAGPITPAIPIQLAITFGIRSIMNKLFPKMKNRKPIFKKKEDTKNE